MHQHHDNPDIFWVHPDAEGMGDGSFEQPFPMLESALERVAPGQTIVLCAGDYSSDCNIQVSGTARKPIHITAETGTRVTIRGGCWFFYDTSDLIVSGLTFEDTPHGAISVVGTCSRNRFDSLRFVNCGARREKSCTLYLGGAGGGCNVVENCSFEQAAGGAAGGVSVGLMVAQGDAHGGAPVTNNVIRRNRFVNYTCGILLGGDESKNVRCSHIVEYNSLNGCSRESILVKSGDTLIRGNIIENGAGNAVVLHSELDCTVEANRIIGCRQGVVVYGKGHTITGNCIVGCSDGAVRVGGDTAETSAATNCFIERNTLVGCTSSSRDGGTPVAGILIDHGTTCVVESNLIHGAGKPYAFIERRLKTDNDGEQPEKPTVPVTRSVVRDNGAAGGCVLFDGVGAAAVEFVDGKTGDYTNQSGFGASGWVLTPQGFDPQVDESADGIDYREASIIEDDAGELIVPGEDIAGRGNLFGNFFAESAENEEGYDETSRYFAGGDE